MKNIIIITFFIFSVMLCSAQSNNQLNDLLNESIMNCLLKENIYQAVFLKDNVPSDFQFTKTNIDNYEVVYFDRNKYRKSELKQGIKSFRLLPIVLKDNMLSITIVKVLVSQNGNNITISSSDYYIYEYQYFCEKKQWELSDIKQKGI